MVVVVCGVGCGGVGCCGVGCGCGAGCGGNGVVVVVVVGLIQLEDFPPLPQFAFFSVLNT